MDREDYTCSWKSTMPLRLTAREKSAKSCLAEWGIRRRCRVVARRAK